LVGIAVAALGAIAAPPPRAERADARRSWVVLWLVALALYVVGFHALANLPVGDPFFRAVTARFWQQSDVVVCMLFGLGLGVLAARAPRGVVAVAGTLLVLTALGRGVAARDRADDTVARYGRAILEPLPPTTILLTRGDVVTNVTRYLQAGEGVRPDVVVLDQELLTKPWYVARAAREFPGVRFPGVVYDPADAHGFTMRALIDANVDAHPLFVYPEWKEGDDSVRGIYELWPIGLASRVAPVGITPSLQQWYGESLAALNALRAYGWRRVGAYRPGTWERVAREDVWQAQQRFGAWLLAKAIERDDARALAAARIALERAEHEHPDPPYFLFRNLGLAYERLALREPALRAQQLEAWRRYLATAPADDDARAAIAATVARLEAEAPSAPVPEPPSESPSPSAR
jgi:hypothetical protein